MNINEVWISNNMTSSSKERDGLTIMHCVDHAYRVSPIHIAIITTMATRWPELHNTPMHQR